MSERKFNLAPLLELKHLSRKEALRKFGNARSDLETEVSYERLKGLDRLETAETDPVALYFAGEKLAVAYVGSSGLAEGTTRGIVSELGEPGAKLASRAGKGSTLYVYPEKGIAFSAEGQSLDFLEVFPPTTLERYKREIYDEPGPFIR